MSLSAAARTLPQVNGKHISVCSLWRWCTKGIRGVKLEYRTLGRRILTSSEWLDAFGKALAELGPVARPRHTAPVAKGRTAKQRDKAVKQAEQSLRASGVKI